METLSVVPSALTVILPNYSVTQMKLAQEEDPIIKQLQIALDKSPKRPSSHKWKHPPLYRYRQLWSQLKLANGIVYRRYSPGPLSDPVDVPIVYRNNFFLKTIILQLQGIKVLQRLYKGYVKKGIGSTWPRTWICIVVNV